MADNELLKHGARVFGLKTGVILVKQTVQRARHGDYVIDEHRERHVSGNDPVAIGQAVLDAIAGRLSKGR